MLLINPVFLYTINYIYILFLYRHFILDPAWHAFNSSQEIRFC